MPVDINMTTVKKVKTKKKKVAKKKSSPVKPVAKKKLTKKKSSKKQTLVLSPVLVINNAKALLNECSQIIKNDQDISIDASAVEMIDTAILQILLAMTIKVKSSNHKVHWINPSDIFISNASLLGLSKPFGIV